MVDNREFWSLICRAFAELVLPAAEQIKTSWESRMFGVDQTDVYKVEEWEKLRDMCVLFPQPENALPDEPARPWSLPPNHFDTPLMHRDIGYYVRWVHARTVASNSLYL